MNQIEVDTIGTLMEPDPVRFSFLAPGWGYLLLLLLLVLAVYGLLIYLRYQKNRYRREAIRLINSISESEEPGHLRLYQVAETVKRVSIQTYGRTGLAEVNGKEWMEFLDARSKGRSVFSEDSRKVFSEDLYRGESAGLSASDLKELIKESITWIKVHHV